MTDVLIVDDDADLVSVTAEVLAAIGYAVRTASNGVEALASVAERRPGQTIARRLTLGPRLRKSLRPRLRLRDRAWSPPPPHASSHAVGSRSGGAPIVVGSVPFPTPAESAHALLRRRPMSLSSVRALGCIALSALLAFACQPASDDATTDAEELAKTKTPDPKAGFDYLVNGGYIQCGFPASVFNVFNALGQTKMSPEWEEQRLPGRNAENANLPYTFTRYRTAKGANLVVTNCLQCHAGHLNGQLVLGLGATDVDFSRDFGADLRKSDLAVRLLLTGENQREWEKLLSRANDISGYNILGTRGPTIANMLMPAILAHQDPVTLEWQKEKTFDLPPAFELPVDVPPWWNVKKKSAMFYNGAARGDFTKHMMLASSFCIDDTSGAKEINARFHDIKAFIETLTPPPYPYSVDRGKAARGKTVFDASCAGCHGTYGAGSSYPNRVLPIGVIGTDPLHLNQVMARPAALEWHAQSYYGKGAPIVEPSKGYVAPPLDGIWATAPYLHNGSVPTLRALLDSRLRPKYWTRTFRSTDYDSRDVGWIFSTKDRGKAAFSGAERLNLYDTTLPGFTNGGHTFGDTLSNTDRDDVIEYLKTL